MVHLQKFIHFGFKFFNYIKVEEGKEKEEEGVREEEREGIIKSNFR